jgi:inner membrane protein
MSLITDTIFTALKVWINTALIAILGITVFIGLSDGALNIGQIFLITTICTLVGSFPACILLCLGIHPIRKSCITLRKKCWLYIGVLGIIAFFYGICSTLLFGDDDSNWGMLGAVTAAIFVAAMLASFFQLRALLCFFSCDEFSAAPYAQLFTYLFPHYKPTQHQMEQQSQPASTGNQSNKIVVKGLITGGLILLLLIPSFFIIALVEEREERQKEIVKEVSVKWSAAQTLTGPFLVVPYTDNYLNSDGKTVPVKTQLIVPANELNVKGDIFPEERKRSIYKVLLYKTALQFTGQFKLQWPSDINVANLDLSNAKLCFAFNDFKGIEEDLSIVMGSSRVKMTAGLPIDDFGKIGLSVPVDLNGIDLNTGTPFSMNIKIKGSERLHFTPLASSSSFNVRSSWANPSFDGEMLPNERTTTDSGFNAMWKFNQANLPFAAVMKHGTVAQNKMAFGVSLVQPADQYAKTMRSVKYAILFIGLTFALFFIIELMQRKPLHPVQYVLVGLALIIFYALLLSLSEYIVFDYAYALAALATILLIALYAHGHFKNIKTSALLFCLLAVLYAFIFVLIRLEDTALLVGSIGLFIVLALVMYASRKINWYGNNNTGSSLQTTIN